MLKHIRIVYVIVGIVLGIVGILMIDPEKTVVYKYPTPENAGKIIYKDKNGVCYKFSSNSVNCDKNESKLKDFRLVI
jgi:hypothetical protein